ncbi:hypothetical protein [Paracoccus sp. (in: a-proteobacteria)]|uniref:hypothetical protein n=1 Tax=Paracoccus sp. TaxID=267 RepID=UPI00272C80EB|nr:hypothetical protein [Paracoccus sp. (in: a-proteobacteria)]
MTERLTDEALGRFNHHPDPAIDFCIEVETLESRLHQAELGLSKLGTQPETVQAVYADICRAMDFIVGGDAGAVDAKAVLRDLARRAAPAATDEALAAQIADQIVPEYRAKGAAYSCSSHTAKRWSAAYDAALLAQRAALSQPAPAPQPADDLRAAAVKAAFAEYDSKPSLDDGADILGRRCAVRGMMVRLGLYAQFNAALSHPEPPQEPTSDMRGALKAHITAVIEGIRHLSVDDAADLLAEIADDSAEDRSEDLINGAILDGIRWGYAAAVGVELGGGAMLRAILPGGCGITHQWADQAVAQPQIKAVLEGLHHARVSASNAGDA